LAAGVGVNLGIEHEDVDVASAGEHVIEAAVADVISPAVAADDPDTLFHQHVGDGQQLLGLRTSSDFGSAFLSASRRAGAARKCRPRLFALVSKGGDELIADRASESLQQFAGEFGLLVDGDADAQAEFGIVFEQGI
jgi:hypothetical protein